MRARVQSNTPSESTAQRKGAAERMVTVVATQELDAGDKLRRFKAEVAQDKPRRGNNKNRYMYIYLGRCLEIVSLSVGFF